MPNLYTDEGPASAQAAPPTPEPEPAASPEDEGNPSAVLPLAIAGEGVKPGDEFKVRAVKVTEDSVVVERCDYEEEGEPPR